MKKVICGVVLTFIAVGAQAAIYKWRDADGKLHFSDSPRPQAQTVNVFDSQSNSIKTDPPPRPAVEKTADEKAIDKAKQNIRDVLQQAKEARAADPEFYARMCSEYKEQIHALQKRIDRDPAMRSHYEFEIQHTQRKMLAVCETK